MTPTTIPTTPPTAWRTDAALMVAIILGLAAVTLTAGERIGINGGQG